MCYGVLLLHVMIKSNWIELNCILFYWRELNWIAVNWTELNWTELNCIVLYWIELKIIELNWTVLNWIELNWIVMWFQGLFLLSVFAFQTFHSFHTMSSVFLNIATWDNLNFVCEKSCFVCHFVGQVKTLQYPWVSAAGAMK